MQNQFTFPWRRPIQLGEGNDHSYGDNTHGDYDDEDDDDDERRVPLQPIPDRATMEARWNFRETIRSETADHRRTIQQQNQHHHQQQQRRNILLVLYDRERRGGNGMILRRQAAGKKVRSKPGGDRSPSTVFESPISTTTTRLLYRQTSPQPSDDDNDNEEHRHHHHARTRNDDDDDDDEESPEAPVDSNEDDDPASSSDSKAKRIRNNNIINNNTFYPMTILREVQTFAENTSSLKYQSAFLHHLGGDDVLDEHGNRPTSSWAVSTISIAFSPNSMTMASTHGDHSVKISCCHTGRLLQSLEGHPRTPWTVKYHPTHSQILASGCLGHQVRVWNWVEKQCLQMVRLEYAIISLSFHPTGQVLAIANGTRLHFWGIDNPTCNNEQYENKNTTATSSTTHTNNQNAINNADSGTGTGNNSRTLLTEMDQRHMLRCVHFPPNGNTIIIGGVNPNSAEEARQQQQQRGRNSRTAGSTGMSFYLRLWDFDLERALNPQQQLLPQQLQQQPPESDIYLLQGGSSDASVATAVHSNISIRSISNPRTFVPRALLYNDGGFDVSPDGKTLCACAEYWLPDGVDNAVDLLYREEVPYGADESNEPPETPAVAAIATADDGDARNHPSASATVAAEARTAVAAALSNLRGITRDAAAANSNNKIAGFRGARSPSFREGMDQHLRTPTILPQTPSSDNTPPQLMDYVPQTPPILTTSDRPLRLSPPSPPGRRFLGGLGQPGYLGQQQPETGVLAGAGAGGGPHVTMASGADGGGTAGHLHHHQHLAAEARGFSTPPPPPPPPAPPAPGGASMRPPHPLSVVSRTGATGDIKGRYVPHVVTVSLDTYPIPEEVDPQLPRGKPYGAVASGYRPRLGQLIDACPLDPSKASAVTCVKFSPSTDFCLIGYGVREPLMEGGGNFHPVTAVYRLRGGMAHVSTMLSGDDDVNIARFHPDSGYGFVYGTKQGRVRILSPRPWNYYNC